MQETFIFDKSACALFYSTDHSAVVPTTNGMLSNKRRIVWSRQRKCLRS